MSYFQRLGDMNYMVEEAEMVDFVNEMDGGATAGVEDVEANEYDLLTKATDTSSGQARNGQDIQGIPWERLNITREKYRLTRLEQYKNYENIPLSGEAVDKRLGDMNYMVEEAEMVDFVNEMDGGATAGVEDVEANEYDLLTKATDTSSGQARNGQDIQGIPWERLNITREKYRLTRLEQYKNYENIPLSGEAVDKECKQMEKGGYYYEFSIILDRLSPLYFIFRNKDAIDVLKWLLSYFTCDGRRYIEFGI
ncbi:uncharacterized protein LOC133681542 [Populus nigra]|uniref:uncharacterized protein LOC133681542 n=1 Tax=Populus nigra TaxID=3691 RepID=UPI002B27BA8D|nr:uncharacterized protein LOC133681542 [Populus nigra]XP_061960597.1 uncharacterized protein LOC133681542 [Populus nigra]XP_061960598.1 uncharacterized protein LOC133681542 [Populus nigra]XP_061960599.1 uncharacterized protein LOC133681542 [Populus nigra]